MSRLALLDLRVALVLTLDPLPLLLSIPVSG